MMPEDEFQRRLEELRVFNQDWYADVEYAARLGLPLPEGCTVYERDGRRYLRYDVPLPLLDPEMVGELERRGYIIRTPK